MSAEPAAAAPTFFAQVWDAQLYIARIKGGEATDYFHSKPETQAAVDELGIREPFDSAVAAMKAMRLEIAHAGPSFDRGEPGVPAPKLRSTTSSGKRVAVVKPEDASLLQAGFWIRDAKVTTNLPYVVKGIIGRQQVVVFWGAPGSGKTFITIEMLCAVGTGQRWRGRRTRRGVAVYVVAESARIYIENRVAALRQESPAMAEADVLVVPLALDLLHAARGDVERVIEAAQVLTRNEGEVLLIAIDTLAATFGGGDENASADMGCYMGNIQRIAAETGAAVLVLHHCGKNEAAGMRGHSALLGALDAELTIEGEPAGERILRTGKVRDGESHCDLFAFTLRPVDLGIDPDGDPVRTCVVDSTDDEGTQRARRARKGNGLGKHQRSALHAVEAAGGRMARPDLITKLRDEGCPRNRAHEAIASLLESKMLVAHNGMIPEVALP